VRRERHRFLEGDEQVEDDDLAGRAIRPEGQRLRREDTANALDRIADRRNLGRDDRRVNQCEPP
jgi:hypothetical protein